METAGNREQVDNGEGAEVASSASSKAASRSAQATGQTGEPSTARALKEWGFGPVSPESLGDRLAVIAASRRGWSRGGFNPSFSSGQGDAGDRQQGPNQYGLLKHRYALEGQVRDPSIVSGIV